MTPWDAHEDIERDDEENPDVIPGMQPEWVSDLGTPRRRDADALPPKNALEAVMTKLDELVKALGAGNALFAWKAGILTTALCIPNFLKSTAGFAYEHKFIWAIFMGQLTIARFRGDTTFGLTSRILATFFGGLVGLAMWYTASGSGHGNPYGVAAVCAVVFPIGFFARLYWPGPPITNIIFFVTIVLVIGYSYQDEHLVIPSSPGEGLTVAWVSIAHNFASELEGSNSLHSVGLSS